VKRATQNLLDNICKVVVCTAALLSVCPPALACVYAGSRSSIFMGAVPPEFFSNDRPYQLRANFAAEVTVIELLEAGKSSIIPRDYKIASYQGIARIKRVIKGKIGVPTLRIVAEENDCSFPFGVGSSGVVVGKLDKKPDGSFELQAMPDSEEAKSLRKRSK
jgi:hypothetical protein